MPKRVVTAEHIARIRELRPKGRSHACIGALIGLKRETVRYHCQRLGIAPPEGPRTERRPAVFLRNGREVRAFTAEEDQRIVRLLVVEKRSRAAIARDLGRDRSSVRGRIESLRVRGLLDPARLAEAA